MGINQPNGQSSVKNGVRLGRFGGTCVEPSLKIWLGFAISKLGSTLSGPGFLILLLGYMVLLP